MAANNFKRIEPGRYIDSSTGVMLLKETSNDTWTLYIDDFKNHAFVTSQWGSPLATYVISGFDTIKSAKDYDYFSLFCRARKPYRNKNGEIISLTVTGLGIVPVIKAFKKDELSSSQGYLF